MRQHLWGNVSGYAHYRLVARSRLSKLRNSVVAQIVETKSCSRAADFADVRLTFLIEADFAGVLQVATHRTVDNPR